jgi:hypothetical protein
VDRHLSWVWFNLDLVKAQEALFLSQKASLFNLLQSLYGVIFVRQVKYNPHSGMCRTGNLQLVAPVNRDRSVDSELLSQLAEGWQPCMWDIYVHVLGNGNLTSPIPRVRIVLSNKFLKHP